MDMVARMKDRLDERTKAFGERLDAAANARQEEIDVQFAEARARASASRKAIAADEGAGGIDDELAALRRSIRARTTTAVDPATVDAASGASRDAIEAGQYAEQVFARALSYLDEAEAAVLGASYARDRAYVMEREGVTGAPATGDAVDPSGARPSPVAEKIGAVVDQVVGSAKHDLGKATGSTRMELEGAAQEAKGHAAWAMAKDRP